jgi:hypothetical protein
VDINSINNVNGLRGVQNVKFNETAKPAVSAETENTQIRAKLLPSLNPGRSVTIWLIVFGKKSPTAPTTLPNVST